MKQPDTAIAGELSIYQEIQPGDYLKIIDSDSGPVQEQSTHAPESNIGEPLAMVNKDGYANLLISLTKK